MNYDLLLKNKKIIYVLLTVILHCTLNCSVFTNNPSKGEKIGIIETYVAYGQYAEKSYIDVASNILDFNYEMMGTPGEAIHIDENGLMIATGSLVMTVADYKNQKGVDYKK